MTSKRRPSFFLVLVLAGAALSARPAQAASKGELSLRADPKYVSPNGDGFQDQAFLYPVVQADAPVTRWRLDIAELGGHRAARLTGATLPGLITWSALDKKGEAALDGAYNARLDVWGKGLHLSTQETFFIDTIPPDVGLVTSTNSIDASSSTGVDFITRADDASPIDRWQIQILDDTGRTVQLFWSTGPAQNVTWDGKERGTGVAVPPGRYHAAFQAWDAAGNESESVFVDLTASATARQEMERSLSLIHLIETPTGVAIQLPSEKIFSYQNGKIVLSDEAGPYLREVGIVANAYGNAGIVLEGYSRAYKSQIKDRNLASLYGWLVYGDLVKVENVKASRIKVKGRGQAGTLYRKSALPPLENGVQVLLQGDLGRASAN